MGALGLNFYNHLYLILLPGLKVALRLLLLYFTYFTRNFSFNHVLGLEGNHYSTFLFTREQQWFHLLCQLVTFQWHLSSGFSWIWHQAQCDFQNSIVSITHFRAILQRIKVLDFKEPFIQKISVFLKLFWPPVRKNSDWEKLFLKIAKFLRQREQFDQTECFVNLFLEVSQIWSYKQSN